MSFALRFVAIMLTILALLLAGCTTISDKALAGAETGVAAAQGDLKDWPKLSDEEKRETVTSLGRALGDVVKSATGKANPFALAGAK